jgi:hypothetical protein
VSETDGSVREQLVGVMVIEMTGKRKGQRYSEGGDKPVEIEIIFKLLGCQKKSETEHKIE